VGTEGGLCDPAADQRSHDLRAGRRLGSADGDERSLALKRSYGCGQLAGCTNLFVFRSATLGYYDLIRQKERSTTAAFVRLLDQCHSAGGLVLVPDATSGCQCSYLNQAWIACSRWSER